MTQEEIQQSWEIWIYEYQLGIQMKNAKWGNYEDYLKEKMEAIDLFIKKCPEYAHHKSEATRLLSFEEFVQKYKNFDYF